MPSILSLCLSSVRCGFKYIVLGNYNNTQMSIIDTGMGLLYQPITHTANEKALFTLLADSSTKLFGKTPLASQLRQNLKNNLILMDSKSAMIFPHPDILDLPLLAMLPCLEPYCFLISLEPTQHVAHTKPLCSFCLEHLFFRQSQGSRLYVLQLSA